MELNLEATKIFFDDSISFDRNINFVFGKNGTGKSTITNLINNQYIDNYDIRIFQGFDLIIGEDNWLNAVTLGVENLNINKSIKSKEIERDALKIRLNEVSSIVYDTINEDLIKAKKEIWSKVKEIESFYSKSATKLAHKNELVDNARTYRKNEFKIDTSLAKFLQESEIDKNYKILQSTKKIAENIAFPILDFSKYQDSVNEILLEKVDAKIIIEELKGDSDKSNFAEFGIKLHEIEDNCSFCGNLLSAERYTSLKSYFSADEVSVLRKKIIISKNKIEEDKKNLEILQIDIENFYPDFTEEAKSTSKDISVLIKDQLNFFESLESSLDKKEKNLFEKGSMIDLTIPTDFSAIESNYKQLVDKNNIYGDNLEVRQTEAKTDLRLHEVKLLIDEYKLDSEIVKLENLKKIEKQIETEFKKVIEECNGIQKNIEAIENEILNFKKSTINTEKLAHHINEKLKYAVNFQLYRKTVEGQEFYEIINKIGEARPITELSTGEKNIIAFLYFVEKLNEVLSTPNNKEKVIIFDDPMNSNDDTMQYIIIDELQKIIKNCGKNENSDKFILLTHNIFFYLNSSLEVKNRRDNKNAFEESNFYKLLRGEDRAHVIKIENRQQDFKTNYEALWHELVFLYNEKKSEMMLNPIRRIIETYIVFNGKEDFYKDNKDAKNLFNTNSHYFTDLEADLNGKNQDEIKNMMKKCFKDNGAESHFNKHWKNAKPSS